jgi:hypothetical protein
MSLAWLKLNLVSKSIGKLAAASLLLTTLGLSGCGDDPVKGGVKQGCTLNSDCNGGLVCSFGLCHQECQITTDCPAGQRCIQTDESNVCQLDDEAGCHFKSDCEEPLVCALDFQCRNQCQEDLDCLKGQLCASGVCAEPPEVGEDGELIPPTGAGGEGGGGPGPTTGGSTGTGGSSGGTNPGIGGDDAGGMGQGGMTTVEPCVPGGECAVDGQPCQVGIVACDASDQPVCEVMSDAEDGVDCGTDQVCSGGECVACKAGDDCQPDESNECIAGTISCATGPSCETAGNVTAGTGCGTDKVCSGGSCVDCKVGDACDPAGQPCKNGTMACSSGPLCQASGNKSAGAECGTDQVCTSNGTCASCVQDGACTPTNVCHQGQQDCAAGPNCVDTQLAGNEGMSCQGNATYNFCTAGSCVACQNGNACVPTNPCHKGTLNCATNPPTCNDSNANATDGLACGDDKSCISGACLTNDRVLTVTSGAVPDTAIDNSFTSVTVHLVDGNNANVAGAAVTVVPSAGAYAVASAATNAQGNAQISGRVGRAVGSYKFTVSAPGATAIEFSVNAIAPAAKSIFTAVNVNHLPGVATPGAGTVSKLNYQARAVAAATDGTLYIADQYSVFQLTPQGVLSRLAGDPNGSYGNTGDTGPGTSAKLSTLTGLALDEANGFLYVADQGNVRVRQIELSSGFIYGYAGGGANGGKPWGDGGPADSAYLSPSGVSVAPNGDLYISDQTSGSIRKVDYNSGVITTAVPATAGCNSNGATTLYSCGGWGDACSVAWDKAGKMFISGYMCGNGNSYFRGVARVEGNGSLSLVAGSDVVNVAEGGAALTAGFTYSPYLAFDKGGNLFLATHYDHRVRRIDAATTKITTVAGTGTAGFSGDYAVGSAAAVNYPTTLAFDGAGNLHFADATNYAIRTIYGIGSSTVPTATLATTGGTGQTVKRDAAFSALTVKLTDSTPANISGASIQWKRLETGSGLSASGADSVASKTGAAGTTSMTGRVGLATGAYKFEASYNDIHGTPVSGSPQTFTVTAADPVAGHIFAIQNYVHTTGLGGYPGPATFAKLQQYVFGVAVASDGNMYVSDQCAVYKISPRGEVEAFAGTPGGCGFSGDSGPALGAKLYYPEALALDETRKVLYIADNNNQRVRMVDLTTGVIDTLAGGGSVSVAPFGDGGPATDANIYYPTAVSVGPDSLVYIPDYGHSKIRVVDPETGIITTWLAGNTTCVMGTVSLYSVSTYGTAVRFAANGDAYVSGNLCQGTTTNNTQAIALRAANGTMTRIAGLYNGVATENADATASLITAMSDFIFDENGDIVMAMSSDDTLRRITMTTGKLNTIAGDGTGTAGYALPTDVSAEPGAYVPATGARLNNPFKIAIWPGNHIIVADEYNYAARMIW